MPDLLGKLDLPGEWPCQLEAHFIEPLTPAAAIPLAPRARANQPRVVIAVLRAPGKKEPAEEMKSYLVELAEAAEGLTVDDQRALAFADGAPGMCVRVAYDPGNGVRIRQQHVFRRDGELVTHLIATQAELAGTKRDQELERILLGWRPA